MADDKLKTALKRTPETEMVYYVYAAPPERQNYTVFAMPVKDAKEILHLDHMIEARQKRIGEELDKINKKLASQGKRKLSGFELAKEVTRLSHERDPGGLESLYKLEGQRTNLLQGAIKHQFSADASTRKYELHQVIPKSELWFLNPEKPSDKRIPAVRH